MDKALFRSVLMYQTTMSVFKNMLEKGIISPAEYAVIDTNIAEKYGLSLSVIYR